MKMGLPFWLVLGGTFCAYFGGRLDVLESPWALPVGFLAGVLVYSGMKLQAGRGED